MKLIQKGSKTKEKHACNISHGQHIQPVQIMDNITKLISIDESKDEKYRRKILGKKQHR